MGFINEIRKIILYSLFAFILIIFTGRILSAELREGDFTTGISGGVMSVKSGNTHPALRIDLGYNITKYLDIEASIITTMNYNNNNFTSVTINPHLYLSPEQSISPYLTLGGGIALFDISGDDSTKPTIIIGGGINYSIMEGVSLRFDLRDYITKDSNMRNNLAISIGLVFYFDPVKEVETSTPVPAPAPQKEPETPTTTIKSEGPIQKEISTTTEKTISPEAPLITTPPAPPPQRVLEESKPAQERRETHKKKPPVKKEKVLKKSSERKKPERIEKGSYGFSEENIIELIKEDRRTYKGKPLKKKD